MHNGEMWLESELDVGTTFYFRLPMISRVPLAISKSEDAKRWFNPYQEYEPRTRPYKAPDLSPSTRYIVVDTENIVHRMLEHQDINSDIVIAHNPAEVRSALNSGPARAVIINLPSTEAQLYFTAADENTQYKTPFLNFWVPGDRAAIERMGVSHYLVKPVGQKALVDALQRLDGKVECILIVDDDPEVHQLFDRMLTASKLPYRMLWAMSGEEGLQILRERDVDVLLLDLLMPVMSGYELLDIKNGDPEIAEIPVIVISAEDPDLRTPTSGEMRISQPGGLTTQDLMRCIVKSTQALVPESQVID
jgi:CheY-like chemotaxis protein